MTELSLVPFAKAKIQMCIEHQSRVFSSFLGFEEQEILDFGGRHKNVFVTQLSTEQNRWCNPRKFPRPTVTW